LATEVAVTTTVKLAETDAGAIYVADVGVRLANVPHALPAQAAPVAVHVTPAFVESPVTLAVNCMACPWSMLGGTVGLIVTRISETGDGELWLQPHINTRIESANASFFIICAFPLP
jgi:hypothetical protein